MRTSRTDFPSVAASTSLSYSSASNRTNDGKLLGIQLYFENMSGSPTNVTCFLAGDATHKRFTESKVVTIVADSADPTKGFAIGNLEELGYAGNDYAGEIDRIYYQLNTGSADITAYLIAEGC